MTSPLPRASAFGPLERRLLLIVLAAVLPVVALSWVLLAGNAERQRAGLLASARNVTTTIVGALDADFDATISALDALAASPRLLEHDLPRFRQEALDLIARRGWTNVVLSTPDAQQVLNAARPLAEPLQGRRDAAGITETVRTGAASIGNVVFSPRVNQYTYSVKVPVRKDGRIVYVLTAVLSTDRVLALIRQQALPPEALLSVLDRNRMVAGRSRDAGKWVGRAATPTLASLLSERNHRGWALSHTLDGQPVYTLWHQSRHSGWASAIGVPPDMIEAPVRRQYALLAAGIAASVALGVMIAFIVARTILQPAKQLEAAALDVGRGIAPTIPATRLPELRQVGLALDQAHRAREEHLASERQLRAREQEARVAAENANTAKDEFLAMLGHELRNPLAPIYTAAQLLPHVAADAGKVRHLSTVLERQAGHLTRMVNDLLDVSRVTRKIVVLQKETVDLNGVVPEALEQVQALASAKRQEVRMTLAPAPALVHADRTRMIQVVANLLQNAVKFTPEDGQVDVGVEADAQQVRVTVHDNGMGIPPALLPQVFDLFKQGEHGLDRHQGGLGLGLSLTRGLVELHGGTITAASPGPGRGSTFTVTLPARAPQA